MLVVIFFENWVVMFRSIGYLAKILLCLFLPLFLGCTKAKEVVPIFPCTDRIVNAYGVNCHLTFLQDYTRRDEELKIMNSIGINMVRGGAHSFALGYRNGIFNPLMMDSVVRSVENAKIPLHGDLSIDAFGKYFWQDYNKYIEYVDYLSSRYNKRVYDWEVINEVDLNVHTSNVAYKYVNLLKCIYPVFKKNGRQNKVLVSGLADVTKPFLDSLCHHEAYKYFDVMNLHSYESPERIPKQLETVRKVMNKYGWEKEVWLGECGMHTAPNTTKRNHWNNGKWLLEEQARRLPRIYLIAFAYGINKVYWYEIRAGEKDLFDREQHFGLLHANLTPKPAFLSYKTLIAKCPNLSIRPRLYVVGENYMAKWTTPKGKIVYAVWSVAPRPLNIKTEGPAKFYDLYGNKIKQPSRLSSSIVYIENAKSVTFIPAK